MKFPKANIALSVTLCACLLSGCSISITSASSLSSAASSESSSSVASYSQQGTEDESSSSASSTLPSPTPAVVVDDTDSSKGNVSLGNDTSKNQTGSLTSNGGMIINESELASYTQNLSRFFHSPIARTADLPLDYNLSFFLLYQTFEYNRANNSYTQDENYFWEIPESDLLQTAKDCLGLSDLSLSDITEWPFGAPRNGVCFYTEETSLPYSDTTVTQVTYDENSGEASVFVDVQDSQYEDASGQTTPLVYHFICSKRTDGAFIYCLQSIDSE